MDPRRLLTFRAVAHERSFSRAAVALSLSQPSVSHQIALLETEVGTRLLDRGRGGIRVTPTGSVLLEHADHVAWRLALADSQVAGLGDKRRETIRIGSFPTAMASFVPAVVGKLRESDPNLRALLSEVTADTLEARLLGGEFDIALSYQDTTAERRSMEAAERIDLFEDTFLVGLPIGHRLAQGTGSIRLAELAEDDWIVPSTEGFLIESCLEAGFKPHVVATSQDPVATRGLIARGLGVGWVPGLLVGDFAGVAIRPVKGEIPRRDIYALLPPGDPHPLAQQVISALMDAAGDFDVPADGEPR